VTHSRVIIITILLAAVVSFGSMAEGYDSLPYFISWDSVEGAGGYLVEARKPGGPVAFRDKLNPDTTRVTLSLPAGEYEIRITTLDRLMNPDSSTKWTSIEVLPDSAPKVIGYKPARYILGYAIAIPLSASSMGEWTEAFLVSPTGKRIKMTVRKKAKNSFTLSGIVTGEVGPYALVLKNSDTRKTEIPSAAIMQYPEMVVTGITPEKSLESPEPMELTISGRRFSPEATFAYRMVASPDPIPLEVINATEDSIRCRTAIPLATGNYEIIASNNSGVTKKPIAQFLVEPMQVAEASRTAKETPPEKDPPPVIEPPPAKEPPFTKESPPAKELPPASDAVFIQAVEIGLGANLDFRPDAWGAIYQNPAISGCISIDAFLFADPRPESGLSAGFLTGLRCDVQYLTNPGASGYYRSSILNAMINVCPGLSLALPRVRGKIYAGAGACISSLEWQQTNLSTVKTTSSFDISAVAGLSVEYKIAGWISFGVAGQFAYVFMTTPSSIYTASAYLSTTLPFK